MKKLLSLSSLFSFIILIMMQSGVTSCTKERTLIDTVTVTHTDTLTKVDTVTHQDTVIIKDTAVSLQLLTANKWKTEYIQGVIGNNITFYQRGGTHNTEDYDNEYIQFNMDSTGVFYDAAGTTHQITWSFSDTSYTKLTFIVFNAAPVPSQTVTWENMRYKNKELFFDQYWTYQGVNSHVQYIRIPY